MNRTPLAASLVLAAALSASTALASADAAPSHHATPAKAGSYTVTASVNNTEPLAGSKIKIKGSVKPAAPGAKVILQLQYADQKTWKTVGTDTLNSAGKFKFKDKVSSVRARKYRVVKQAGPNRAAGHSKSLKVVVYGWRDLTTLSPATATSMNEVSSAAMNGVVFPNSLRAYIGFPPPGTTGSIEYNLNRGCKAFRGTVGLDDSSPAAGTATIGLATDGTSRYSGSFALTQSAPVAFDVTKVFRLSIGSVSTGGGLAAVGTPQVLCNS
jgi:hypothetical protein